MGTSTLTSSKKKKSKPNAESKSSTSAKGVKIKRLFTRGPDGQRVSVSGSRPYALGSYLRWRTIDGPFSLQGYFPCTNEGDRGPAFGRGGLRSILTYDL